MTKKRNEMRSTPWLSIAVVAFAVGTGCTTTDPCPHREHYWGKMVFEPHMEGLGV